MPKTTLAAIRGQFQVQSRDKMSLNWSFVIAKESGAPCISECDELNSQLVEQMCDILKQVPDPTTARDFETAARPSTLAIGGYRQSLIIAGDLSLIHI